MIKVGLRIVLLRDYASGGKVDEEVCAALRGIKYLGGWPFGFAQDRPIIWRLLGWLLGDKRPSNIIFQVNQ